MRVGGDSDGSYVIPDDLVGVDLCVSPGVNTCKLFEDELLSTYGIRSVLCDPTISENDITTPLVEGSQILVKKWVSSVDSDQCVTLDSLNHRFFSSSSHDKILQIDIEGGEYEAICSSDLQTLKEYRMITIEIHELGFLAEPWTQQYYQILELSQILSESFVCVHAHGNNCCGELFLPGLTMNIPRCLELTLLRKDRLLNDIVEHGDSAPVIAQTDGMQNVPGVDPIMLGDAWFNTSSEFTRSFRSAWLSMVKSAIGSYVRLKLGR